jgi:hypothetical protein
LNSAKKQKRKHLWTHFMSLSSYCYTSQSVVLKVLCDLLRVAQPLILWKSASQKAHGVQKARSKLIEVIEWNFLDVLKGCPCRYWKSCGVMGKTKPASTGQHWTLCTLGMHGVCSMVTSLETDQRIPRAYCSSGSPSQSN